MVAVLAHFAFFVALLMGSTIGRADSNIVYFDFPEGAHTILSSTSRVNPFDAANPDLRVLVSQNARFIISGYDRNGYSVGADGQLVKERFFRGDVEWVDSQGRKRVLKNVFIPESSTRATPLRGRDLTVSPVNVPKKDCPENTPDSAMNRINQVFRDLPGSKADVGTALAFFGAGSCIALSADEKAAQEEQLRNPGRMVKQTEPHLFRRALGRQYDQVKKNHSVVATHKGFPLAAVHLIAIDAMARTIYGEMRGCMKHGKRYPMAVARVIMNRADAIRDKGLSEGFVSPKSEGHARFRGAENPRTALRGVNTAVIVPHLFEAPRQFSVWNKGDANNDEVLCPKKDSAEWKTAIEVATAAVTKDPDFMKQTDELKGIEFYSSGMTPSWAGTERTGLTVGGQPLDKRSCIQLWNRK